MQTNHDLSKVPRRDLRSVLFCLRDWTDISEEKNHITWPLRKIVKSNGVSLQDFAIGWDLGIDDAWTMQTRRDKHWLWGISRTVVVPAKPGFDARSLLALGFGHETPQGVAFSIADYKRILAGVAERKGW